MRSAATARSRALPVKARSFTSPLTFAVLERLPFPSRRSTLPALVPAAMHPPASATATVVTGLPTLTFYGTVPSCLRQTIFPLPVPATAYHRLQ
jgi:hypothetical protein